MSTGWVVWITGLSGAGKTTLSRPVAAALRDGGRNVVLLDGDELRGVIGGKIGHSEIERREVAERYSHLCRLVSIQGVDVVCATMSLFHSRHVWNRANIPKYVEVYLKVDLETLVARDPKGLYRRALAGEASNVVGIDLPFEEPLAPDLVIDNNAERSDMDPLVDQVLSVLRRR